MSEKIMLIDGNSIINRAFYSLPEMSISTGEKTNAVYGFLNIFFKLYDEERPDYVAVAFDTRKPTFRHEMYGEYKGTRKSMPDDLRPQIPLLKALLAKMEIKAFELEGFEADDLLGTMVKKSCEASLNCVVVSGDRDLLQLASDTTVIRIPKTRGGQQETESYTGGDVLEKMGVTPEEYIDVKALMGDASDNIPGVPGIGEKTAFKIIQEYKTLEAALEAAPDIKPAKASKNLILFKEQAIMSKELATIVTDAPIEFDPHGAKPNLYNDVSLDEIKRLEFKSLIRRFDSGINATEKSGDISLEHRYRHINDAESARAIALELCKRDLVAFSLVFDDSACIGISFAAEGIEGVFIEYTGGFGEVEALDGIRRIFERGSDSHKLVCLDSKRDMVHLHRFGIEPLNIAFDASLAAYILDPLKSTYNYDDISLAFLNEACPGAPDVFGKGKKKRKPEQGELIEYACRQAGVVYQAYPLMDERLAEQNQSELYYNIELPLAGVLRDMELFGIKVDSGELTGFGAMLDMHIKSLEQKIYEMADCEFNLNSPQQLSEVLFVKLGLKGGKKTTQGYSTAAEELERLRDKHEIVPLIQEYRPYVKLKSTYVDGLLPVIDSKTGKIHSTFNQKITATGRISSTEPNLQNIPIRMELGRKLRKAFVPSDDSYVFLDADYSQIELRLMAHMSGDEAMISAFEEGEDIHRMTAAKVLGIDPADVTPAQRNSAKAVNFGIIYGISAFSLSQDLGITKKEADRYIAGYFEKYPGVKKYLDAAVLSAGENGCATTLFGRRRPVPEIKSSNFVTRAFGERVAMNMPVQGSAADIIKIAMIRVSNRLKSERLKSRLILQIHDELLLEVSRDELELTKRILREEMENAANLSVRLEVDLHEGETWYDTK